MCNTLYSLHWTQNISQNENDFKENVKDNKNELNKNNRKIKHRIFLIKFRKNNRFYFNNVIC